MKYRHPPPQKKTNKTEQRKGRGSEAEREKAQATVYTLGHVHGAEFTVFIQAAPFVASSLQATVEFFLSVLCLAGSGPW